MSKLFGNDAHYIFESDMPDSPQTQNNEEIQQSVDAVERQVTDQTQVIADQEKKIKEQYKVIQEHQEYFDELKPMLAFLNRSYIKKQYHLNRFFENRMRRAKAGKAGISITKLTERVNKNISNPNERLLREETMQLVKTLFGVSLRSAGSDMWFDGWEIIPETESKTKVTGSPPTTPQSAAGSPKNSTVHAQLPSMNR